MLSRNYALLAFPMGDQRGGVSVASNGGAVLFYAHDAEPATVERLASWLAKQTWCGVMLASERVGQVPGTIPASIANIDGQRSPDLAMSFAWNSVSNVEGYPGNTAASGGTIGVGTHGGMSRQELHNTLIARGPSFIRSSVVGTPTGNIDIAPTILHILDLPGGEEMDGRVLHEALDNAGDSSEVEFRTVTRTAELSDYRQEVTVTSVRGSIYLDEGNAVI